MNNNQLLIDGLKQVIAFLEATPELPMLDKQYLRAWMWGDKEKFKEMARHLGSFRKEFNGHHFELHKPFNEAVELDVLIDREQFCRKVVTWDCSDDESLLKLVAEAETV